MKRNLPLTIIMVSLAVLFLAGCRPAQADDASADVPLSAEPLPIIDVADERPVQQDPHARLAELEGARRRNPDVIAWLTLPGTDVDGPVLQAEDNETYLRSNIEGEYDVWGSYFVDYECDLSDPAALDRNTIIYGHSLDDSAEAECFSQLKRYDDPAFAAQNPQLYLSIWGRAEPVAWAVFAAGRVPVGLGYIYPDLSDEEQQVIMDSLRTASTLPFEGVQAGLQDQLLLLSTCTSDPQTRYVVAAKRLIP